jgi:hypothetical protein
MELCAIAQEAVESSMNHSPTLPSQARGRSSRLNAMKERFPVSRRNVWRQRFLAIARELEGSGAHRRDSLDASHKPSRAGLLAARTLRGVRLGCVRTA